MADNEDAIAIVGVGCRFPGADNISEFWRVLVNGENHLKEVPKDRWYLSAYYDANPEAPGKTYTRKIAPVLGHDEFDNHLYGVSELEAAKIDPQQRFVLDSVHMALEDGGFVRDKIQGSRTGVYIGVMNNDYGDLNNEPLEFDNNTMTGTCRSIIAARVAFVYNLFGPAMCVDTACSSALVAIHLGTQAIRSGDCDMSICGGVNAIMNPNVTVILSKAKMMSTKGQCHAFSADADGYARGEGCGVVILKRLSQAIKDEDKIWATIETGSNQDGRTVTPITAPSGSQQLALLERLYGRKNIDKSKVQYIEAHGTGTPKGDPIEANSLGSFFGGPDSTRYIGSVKTNIGHLESAAGAAGLIKLLLMMDRSTIVPSLHYSPDNANPAIDFMSYNFQVPTKCLVWPELSEGGRIACVNSFGFGGSNCHAFVKQYAKPKARAPEIAKGHRVVTLSANSAAGLRDSIKHTQWVIQNQSVDLDGFSYTSTCRRDHFPYRILLQASSKEELLQELQLAADGTIVPKPRRALKFIYCFSGMGTAWPGMCQELLNKDHVFKETLEQVDTMLSQLSTVSIIKELQNPERLNDPLIEPLVLFGCQIGLAAVWRSWGFIPDTTLGQSVGEVAAAYVAGMLSLESAVLVIFYRTKLLTTVSGGKMALILNRSFEDVESLCAQYPGKVNIAVYHSPKSCSLSGEKEEVDAVCKALQSNNTDTVVKSFNVHCAFHSHRQECLMEPLVKSLNKLSSGSEETAYISTTTGDLANKEEVTNPMYWARNLRQPVLWSKALLNAVDKVKENILIEIGPKPILPAHQAYLFNEYKTTVLASMRYNNELPNMLKSLGIIFSMGYNPKWSNVTPQIPQCLIEEPRYQFQRKKHLVEGAKALLERQGKVAVVNMHPYVKRVPSNDFKYEIHLSEQKTPFVYSHKIATTIVVPGALYCDAALEVGMGLLGTSIFNLSVSVKFVKVVYVLKGKDCTLQFIVDKDTFTKQGFSFTIYNQNTLNVHGHVYIKERKGDLTKIDIRSIEERCQHFELKDVLYEKLRSYGIFHGEGLDLMTKSQTNPTECLATLEISELVKNQMHLTRFHPIILDGLLQAVIAMAPNNESQSLETLPARFEEVTLVRPFTKNMKAYGKLLSMEKSCVVWNIFLVSEDGEIIAELKNFASRVLSEKFTSIEEKEFYLNWVSYDLNTRVPERQQVLLLTDDGPNSSALLQVKSNPQREVLIHSIAESLSDKKVFSSFLKTVLSSEMEIVVFFNAQSANQCLDESEKVVLYCERLFLDLKDVLFTIAQEGTSVPITILTSGTQVCPMSDTANINVFDSILWGMMRCVAQESVYPKLQIVDVQNFSKDNSSILFPLLEDFRQNGEQFRELMIANGEVYKSQVSESRNISERVSKSSRVLDSEEPVQVISENTIFSQKHYLGLRYIQKEAKPKPPLNYANIKLRKVVLHNESFYPNRKGLSNRFGDVWSLSNSSSRHLLCLEGEGWFDDKNVVVCFPMPMSSDVNVPDSCVFPKEMIPCHKPGVLLTLILLSAAIENISSSTLSILCDNTRKTIGKLAAALASTRGVAAELVVCDDNEFTSPRKADSALLLSDILVLDLVRFIEHHKVKHVFAIDGLKGANTARECIAFGIEQELTIVSPIQTFQANTLKMTCPKLKQVLQKHKKQLTDVIMNLTDTCLSDIVRDVVDFNTTDLILQITEETWFRRTASYVVVGGFGGLGQLLVETIAEKGAGVIAIISRSAPSDEMRNRLDDIQTKYGTLITCINADITDFSNLKSGIDGFKGSHPNQPIRGIFHGAGVLDDAILLNMERDRIHKCFMPKIVGSLNLHYLSLELNLDYFMMHSSVTSIFGKGGQSNYGAANSFQDALAWLRRKQDLPGQSINWGPLNVGMAMRNTRVRQNLESAGFLPMTESDIKKYFIQALLSDKPQICFVDLKVKNESMLIVNDVRRLMNSSGVKLSKSGDAANMDNIYINVKSLKALEKSERVEKLTKYVKSVADRVLPFPSEEIDTSTALISMGMDSMLAITFINKIQEDVGERIPLFLLLGENSTLESVAYTVEETIMSTSGDQTGSEEEISVALQKLMKLRITPWQQMIYDGYVSGSPHNLRAELTVDKSHKLHLWKSFFVDSIKEMKINTLFVKGQDGVEPIIDDRDDFPEIFTMLDKDTEDLEKAVFDFYETKLDLSKDIGIRVLIHEGESEHRIYVLLCCMIFDQFASFRFFDNKLDSFTSTHQSKYQEEDLNGEIMKVLAPNFKRLDKFWKTRVNQSTVIPLITLSDEPQSPGPIFCPNILSAITLNDQLVESANMALQYHSSTAYQLYTSVYILLMHLASGCQQVALETVTNIRTHVPALKGSVFQGVNKVPIISKLDPNVSIESYIFGIVLESATCSANGLFPHNLIRQNTSDETRYNMTRHGLTMLDMDSILDMTADIGINFDKPGSPQLKQETIIYVCVSSKRRLVKFILGYAPFVRREAAEAYLQTFADLLEYVFANPKCLIKDIPEKIYEKAIVNQKPYHSQMVENIGSKHITLTHKGEPKTDDPNGLTHPVNNNIPKGSTAHMDIKVPNGKKLDEDVKAPNGSKIANGSTAHVDTKLANGCRVRVDENVSTDYTAPTNSMGRIQSAISFIRAGCHMEKSGKRDWMSHKVFVRYCQQTDRIPRVVWGKTDNISDDDQKAIPLTKIKKITHDRVHGLHVMKIHTAERKYIFKTDKVNLMEKWMMALEHLLSPTTTHM